jgi:hypothetical protein
MYVSIATEPGGPAPNEDWVAGTPTLAIVFDGLSTAGLETGCKHGVPWYVAQLGSRLVSALADPTKSLTDGLAGALMDVAALHPECDLSNPSTPSSTVSILREHSDHFSYLVLADSPIVFEGEHGCNLVTDWSVERVVHDLKAETERYSTGSPEHSDSVRRMVSAQRHLRNVPGGYWVAAADPSAAEHAVTGTVPYSEIRSVAVMSDGVSCLVTDYEMATWRDVFRHLRSDGTIGLIDRVRKIEASDSEGRRWPRYKASDDAAIAFCVPKV